MEVDHRDGVYREGETLRIRFAAEIDAHLYLLYHQSDGQVALLFPNLAQSANRIRGKEVVQIPPPNGIFRFRIRPPFGTEFLQVLAATSPITELDRLIQKNGKTPEVSPGLLNGLPELLDKKGIAWAEHRVPIRTIAAADPKLEHHPVRAGLFIGIGQYLHPEVAETHEELRHSAELMHAQLLERGGLDPKLTRLITDQRATRASLEECIFRWLPSVTHPGDTVFIYFSGHAGQLPRAEAAQRDELSTMIAPYDYDAGDPQATPQARLERERETAIVDDALTRWLEELSGRQIVLILDTCHSGGVVAEKDFAKLFKRNSSRLKAIAQLNTVVLTSCARDEESLFEGTPNKTMWFTYFLAEAIIKLPRPVSVQAAHEYTRKGIKLLLEKRGEARPQEPQLTDNALLPINLAP